MTFAAVIIALFMYVGSYFMMTNVVTGTSTTDTVVQTVVPLAFAGVIFGLVVGVFNKS